jgi:hypothetical protein
MATLDCWALEIKSHRGAFVKLPPGSLPYSPYRTMLFKSRKVAFDWAQSDPYWRDKVEVKKVTVTTKGFME